MIETVVVDASVAIKWVIPEEQTDAALRARGDFSIFAPELIVPEIANILWKKHRRSELTAMAASVAAGLLANSGITLLPMADLMRPAVDLAMRPGHPAYDRIYIAAAAKLECGFLTADSRLIRKLRQSRFDAVKCMDLTQEI